MSGRSKELEKKWTTVLSNFRKSVVLEMYSTNDSHDQTESVALRIGPYKIIQGRFRDSEWYSEPVSDMVNSTDKGSFN